MSRLVSDETFRHAGETIFQSRRSPPETSHIYQRPRSTTWFSHICVHSQRNLPRSSQELPVGHGKLGGKVMTEVVTAVLVFLSVGVFLAHAFDAYRTGAVGTRNPRY